jgi:5-methylcytosine-specific restriction endonuclease McrA
VPLRPNVASARPPARLPGLGGRYAQQLTAAVLATYGTVCHLCRSDGADTADHLNPRSKGRGDDLANLRPAHQGCNSLRGAMPLTDWFAAHPVPRREPLPPSREW